MSMRCVPSVDWCAPRCTRGAQGFRAAVLWEIGISFFRDLIVMRRVVRWLWAVLPEHGMVQMLGRESKYELAGRHELW